MGEVGRGEYLGRARSPNLTIEEEDQTMTKKHFISLARHIKTASCEPFTQGQLLLLAKFCQCHNPRFNEGRWLGYIQGENGPNGGRVKG